jgi:ABC-type sugar transport system permease subunit
MTSEADTGGAVAGSPGRRPRRPAGSRGARARRWGVRLAFLAPAFAAILVFRIVPTLGAFRLSLTEWTGFADPVYVGFENFQRLVSDPAFFIAFRNNLLILASTPLGVGIPLLVALVLNTKIFMWRFFRTVFFLPAVLSPVIIGTYYSVILSPDGPFNTVLDAIGLDFLVRGWLADPATALPTYIVVTLWGGIGVGVLIFMAALSATEPDLEDAARIDGANWFQIQRYVIIPQLRPTIEFWFVLLIIVVFTAQFPLVFTLTRGGPGHSSTVLEYLIYQRAFVTGSLGYGAAMGVILFLIVAFLVAIVVLLTRRSSRSRG